VSTLPISMTASGKHFKANLRRTSREVRRWKRTLRKVRRWKKKEVLRTHAQRAHDAAQHGWQPV